MTTQELNAKTVLELRKIAKENGVKLGAGVSKSDIVEKISAAMAAQEPAPAEAPAAAPAPAAAVPAAAPAQPAQAAQTAQEEKPAQPQFRQAWSNPSPAPRFSGKPAYQAPPYQPRQNNWQQRPANRPMPSNDMPRTQTVRPANYTPRFGPAADEASQSQDTYRPAAPVAPSYRPERPAYSQDDRPAYQQPERPAFQQERPAYQQPERSDMMRSSYNPPYEGAQRSGSYDSQYQQPRSTVYQPRRDPAYLQQELTGMPSAAELMTPAECMDGSGVLEMHPDGYGFLRAQSCLPSSRDIYIAQAQVRRFGLRSGDMIVGKIRPQRDGDKYAAMLYITEINGMPADEAGNRPIFDELTPVYPDRRINLDPNGDKTMDDMRIVDLIAPMGFGQRALVYCPPECDKKSLMEHFAQVIMKNHPDVSVFALLLDERPEDVTLFRDAVPGCTVVASTFGQQPETHLRVADLLLERLMRLVETGRDVVLLVDSLTRYVKICPAAMAQQRGLMPGMVVPTSLHKAKRLFSAARCMREGGSLTVIGMMNAENSNRVDDAIIEDFAGTANMELRLDASMARAGVQPPINLQESRTAKAERLLTPLQLEGLGHTRRILGTTPSAQAVPQLLSMMDKAGNNDEFLARISDWAEQMEKSR